MEKGRTLRSDSCAGKYQDASFSPQFVRDDAEVLVK
jgi:hypothetical protein